MDLLRTRSERNYQPGPGRALLLIGDDLTRLAALVKTARQCNRIIMTNFAGTLAVDGLGVALAAAGLLNPIAAALIHVTSELIFILNSARLLTRGGHAGFSGGQPDALANTNRPLTSVDATI